MPRLVAFVLAVVVTCAVAVGGVIAYTRATDRRIQPGPATEPEAPRVVPGPGQTFVTGDIDVLVAEGAAGGTVPAPFALSAGGQGAGGATIEGALVAGRRSTIEWSGGTPLSLGGTGGLELGPTTVEVAADGALAWSLGDGQSRALRPGTYRTGGPVAVGAAGLAEPREGVEFTADSLTVLNARGQVLLRLPPQTLELTGPGRVSARGRLQVLTAERTETAASVELADGPYRITLAPTGNQARIDAVLQGELSVR